MRMGSIDKEKEIICRLEQIWLEMGCDTQFCIK